MNEETYQAAMQSYQQEYMNNLPRWQLDLAAELHRTRMSLLGLVLNPNFSPEDPREYIQLPGSAFVNERGATAIHNKLQSELTKIPSDTNYTKEIIETEIIMFDREFSYWLLVNHENFGLDDNNYNTVCEIAVRLVKGAMLRSIGGWKGNLINSSVQQREVIQNITEVERSKPKLFGFLGGS
jgi:hypothetical protein